MTSTDSGEIHVVEVVNGIGFGGAELALIRRLRHQPEHVITTVISTDPDLHDLSPQVAELVHSLIETVPARSGSQSLAALVRAHDPDVVIIHTPRGAFQLLRGSLPREVPCVFVVHATFSSPKPVLQPVVSTLLSIVNPRAALHLAVSSAAATGSQSRRARNIRICHLGGELEPAGQEASPWPIGARLRLLSLSRLTASKNLLGLLEAVRAEGEAMRSSGAFLAIVGDGPESTRLAAAIAENGIGDIVGLHRAIVPASAVLQEADELIVSSTSEGGPITIFEALLAGTRVTSTPVGVAPDVLVNDEGLRVLPSASVESLRAGLRRSLARTAVELDEREHRAEQAGKWQSANTAQQFYELALGTRH